MIILFYCVAPIPFLLIAVIVWCGINAPERDRPDPPSTSNHWAYDLAATVMSPIVIVILMACGAKLFMWWFNKHPNL